MSDCDVDLRPLRSWAEFRACEALQREVWGEEFSELASASLLMIGQRLGGVSSAAFHPEEGLVGFVFGLTGLEDGRPVHWSHMLAVRSGYRGRGIGRRLKEHQRELLLERGVGRAHWTFDPLVAANAHFNLHRLGVHVVKYTRDMYGRSGSDLHRCLGTDRLVVVWELEDYEPVGAPGDAAGGSRIGGAATADGPAPDDDASPTPAGDPAAIPLAGLPGGGELPSASRVGIAVPRDIHALWDTDPDAACAWRASTRAAFEGYLARGYRVLDFVATRDPFPPHYLLEDAQTAGGGPTDGPPGTGSVTGDGPGGSAD
ncbi:MAG: GNAT family N-acetyltransferase [Gemmatimonadota bacterium]